MLRNLTQLPSIIGFAGKVVAAKAGQKTIYITPAGGTYEIVYTPDEVRQSYEAALFSNTNTFDVKLIYNAGVQYLDCKEYDKAFLCFQKANEQGYISAQTSLALCYETGWGTTQDLSMAEYLYKKADAAGDKNAAINLGLSLKPHQTPITTLAIVIIIFIIQLSKFFVVTQIFLLAIQPIPIFYFSLLQRITYNRHIYVIAYNHSITCYFEAE